MTQLDDYKKKRDFIKTAEPEGGGETTAERLRYAVQHHLASRDHYDFRLEWEGVLLSWAVPKGPSYNPQDKRLAVRVEPHPLEYRNFEGTIPKGEYGGGTVMLWDEGFWRPFGDAAAALESGSLKFELLGGRLKGAWALIRLRDKGDGKDNWLLLKEKDGFAKDSDGVSDRNTSIRTGRTMDEIAGGEDEKLKKNPFERVDVQLAKQLKHAPKEPGWVYEPKYDGYRIIAFIENNRARLVSRNGKDYTSKFISIADSLEKKFAGAAAVLDGEVIVVDENGKSDFKALQSHIRNPKSGSLTYAVFDILAYDGHDLRQRTLTDRKSVLEKLLKDAPWNIYYSKAIEGDGKDTLFEAACRLNLEGIVGKKADSAYSGGRNGDWIKLKCRREQEFVVGGYTLSDKKTKGIGSLLLGYYENDRLRFAGRAGTGFTESTEKELLTAFDAVVAEVSPFADDRKIKKNATVVWLRPVLVAAAAYAEWTSDKLLRQASFKGLRADKDARQVTAEGLEDVEHEDVTDGEKDSGEITENPDGAEPESGGSFKSMSSAREKGKISTEKAEDKQVENRNSESAVDKSGNAVVGENIKITNPDKIIYKNPEIKKLEVVGYYAAAAPYMLPFIKNRILSIVRCPKGIAEACFYKKHPGAQGKGIVVVPIASSGGDAEDYFYIESAEGLIYEAQMGTLEFHTWGSRASMLEKPDLMVFDLDPDEGMDLSRIRQGVRDIKSILDELSLVSFLKVSGGKGYHIVVPFEPSADWTSFSLFARNVAEVMERKWGDRYTSNMRKDKRKGRIFIDWVRNGRGATSIAPYSLRARDGARVALPISWDELETARPDAFSMRDALDRLGRDPWKGFFEIKQRLRP